MTKMSNRDLVTPGTQIGKGNLRLREGVFREGNEIFSSVVGLVDRRGNSIRVIPLAGAYIPNPGDRVIAMVTEVQFMGWMTFLRSPTPGILKVGEVPQRFDPIEGNLVEILATGDLIFTEVISVNKYMQIKLSMRDPQLRKLMGGRIFTIDPVKVPRVIGRRGSMISMLKRAISEEIIVGQNGIIWARCENIEQEELLKRILEKIEAESHTSGLTNRVKEILKEEVGSG